MAGELAETINSQRSIKITSHTPPLLGSHLRRKNKSITEVQDEIPLDTLKAISESELWKLKRFNEKKNYLGKYKSII